MYVVDNTHVIQYMWKKSYQLGITSSKLNQKWSSQIFSVVTTIRIPLIPKMWTFVVLKLITASSALLHAPFG